jgi:hypothetical protein
VPVTLYQKPLKEHLSQIFSLPDVLHSPLYHMGQKLLGFLKFGLFFFSFLASEDLFFSFFF